MVSVRYGTQQSLEKLIVVDVPNKPEVLGRNWMGRINLDFASMFKIQSNETVDLSEKFLSYLKRNWEIPYALQRLTGA